MTCSLRLMICAASLLGTLGALPGCKSKGGDKGGGSGAAAGTGGGGSTPGTSAGGGGGAAKPTTAEGGEVTATQTVTDCPKSLAGSEKVNRIIKKECGVVPVTGDYSVDNATLTLEAGATLAFAPDAALSIGYYGPAKLVVRGTKDAPVTMTTSGDKAAGVWKGILLADKAARSSIEGLVLEYAGTADHPALDVHAVDVTVNASTIKSSRGHALATSRDARLASFAGNAFVDVGVPDVLVMNPVAAASIAADTKFPPKSRVKVTGGKLATSVTWQNIGVPYTVLELIEIDGDQGRATLELAPGTTVLFDSDSGFSVGYYHPGAIKAVGTAAAPIHFTAFEGTEPGSWDEIQIHGKGEGTFENVVFELGGAKDRKGVLLANAATLSVKSCTFKQDKRGVVLEGNVTLKAFDANTFDGTADALALTPALMGGVGTNTYGADSKIEVSGGKIDHDVTWKLQTAVLEITGTIEIDKGRLTVEAGNKLVLKDDAELSVGYYEQGGLQLLGTADKPIDVRGMRDEQNAWKGIHLYNKARANIIRHTTIHGAAGDAAVVTKEGAELEVDDLSCDKCQAAVESACKAKISTKGIKALGGTPKAEIKPADCK